MIAIFQFPSDEASHVHTKDYWCNDKNMELHITKIIFLLPLKTNKRLKFHSSYQFFMFLIIHKGHCIEKLLKSLDTDFLNR